MKTQFLSLLLLVFFATVLEAKAQEVQWQPYEQTGFHKSRRKAYAVVQTALAVRLQKAISEEKPDKEAVLSLLEKLIPLAINQDDYETAEKYCRAAIQCCKQLDGSDQGKIASFTAALAHIEAKQKKYVEAEADYKEALKICETLGKINSIEVVPGLSGLATVYASQKKYSAAESLYEKAIAMQRASAEGVSPMELNLLAELYCRQGRWKRAEKVLQQALTIDEQQLGMDQPALAASLNNLAYVYFKTKKFDKALTMSRRSVEICQKWNFGDLAQWLETYAAILKANKQDEKAAEMISAANKLKIAN